MRRFTVIDERNEKKTAYQKQVIEQFKDRPYAAANAETGRRIQHFPTFKEAMNKAKELNEEQRAK
jgi:hypothetical protein